jgi:hypothetical protein
VKDLSDIPTGNLSRGSFTADELACELERVADMIRSHATSGVDLGYWFDRERALNAALDRKEQ